MAASYVVRRGLKEDCDDLLRLILGLADHEGVSNPTMTKDIILEDAFGDRPCLDFFVGEFQPNGVAGAGDQERKVVGFASINRFNHSICYGRSAILSGLYIDEAHRGKGLGSALMKAVSKACLDLGLVSLNYDVLSKNLRTRKFYSSLGVTNNTEKKGWEYWQFLEKDMKRLVTNMELECSSVVSIKLDLDKI